MTDFGELKYLKVYFFSEVFIESVIPTLLLIILNIISLVKFKIVINRVAQIPYIRNVEINLVKLALFHTFICICVRLLDIAPELIIRFQILFNIQSSNEMESLRLLLKQSANFILFGAHAFDSILFYFYDSNLKRAADNYKPIIVGVLVIVLVAAIAVAIMISH